MTRQLVKRLGYTDPRGYDYALIHLDALIPDPKNPRIPLQESAAATILEIVRQDSDGLFKLASDIAALGGTNPAELHNVSQIDSRHYVVREGNRRLVARKLLHDPAFLRGHVSDAELRRWTLLAQSPDAGRLPDTLLSVIGEDHEVWVDRRHLGLQAGVGLQPWDTEAKRRRDQRRSGGGHDLAVMVVDALRDKDPERFGDILPPRGTFTTFARIVEDQQGRDGLGIELDAEKRIRLRHGDVSLGALEEILHDLRRPRDDQRRLTSRRIHSTKQIVDWVERAKRKVPRDTSEAPITLRPQPPGDSAGGTSSGALTPKPSFGSRSREIDVMRQMNQPRERRLRKVFDELGKARRSDSPNAAMLLTRMLLELSLEASAVTHELPFANDSNPDLEREFGDFWKVLNEAGVKPSPLVKEALRRAKKQPLSLSDKLQEVIDHLVSIERMSHKEGEAKKREISTVQVVALLNDAVHRLNVTPSVDRVTHILDVLLPVYNAITSDA